MVIATVFGGSASSLSLADAIRWHCKDATDDNNFKYRALIFLIQQWVQPKARNPSRKHRDPPGLPGPGRNRNKPN